jgi:hypothetical protein
MYATPTFVAEQIAREYARDRIREAEARRTARTAREGVGKHRRFGTVADSSHPVRRWRIFPARTTTA